MAAYEQGNDDLARTLYPQARFHWESIETVAESFGDLDPKIDAREADLTPGQKWTGWHRIEKDLWPQRAKNYTPLTHRSSGSSTATTCSTNVTTVRDQIRSITFTTDQIANGSSGLMEEVATGQGHRRGGVLVAHRPLGLPGQRRGCPGGLRGRQADPRASATPPWRRR